MSETKHHRKPRRSTSQLARDRREIAKLYLQGVLQADIAKTLELSQSTVSLDLKALRGEWLKDTRIDFDAAKAIELAKIDHLERVYYAAWWRSYQDAEMVTQKQKGKAVKRKGKDGKFVAERPAEVSKTSKGQAGDPRFLQGVQWCIDKRCKIKGIDAATKVEHTGKGGGPISVARVDLSRLTDDELDTLERVVDRLAE